MAGERDYRVEMLTALDALDEQHRRIHNTKEPMLLTAAIAELERRFTAAAQVAGEIENMAQGGNATAREIVEDLAPRFDRSYAELQRSVGIVQAVFQRSFDLILADPKDLPKA